MRPLLLALAVLACGSAPATTTPPPPPPPGGMRILMLGNSLTSYNDLPGMVAELAHRGGAERPSITAITFANFSLEDHWNNTISTEAMDTEGYDLVIMQQGPSTLAESGASLREFSGKIASRMVKHGTRAGMYVVWPPQGGDIDAGILHYTEAATAGSMALYPVAHAFRQLRATAPGVPLYGSDDFHPSYAGSWLAAMIIAAVIFDQDPASYPNLFPRFIPAAYEAPLRASAKAVVDGYGRR